MKRAIYLLSDEAYDLIYGPAERASIDALVDVIAPQRNAAQVTADPDLLADVEVILSGWGMARLDETLLDAAPKLEAIFYGAGSVRGFMTDAAWARSLTVVSAWAGNAVPVSEFTLAQIFYALKRGWHYVRTIRELGAYPDRGTVPGGNGSTVGLVSLGMVGRRVAALLQPFDVQVIAYDPYVPVGEAAALGVDLVSLAELFRRSDVVSLHTPWLPETEGMITGTLLKSMKPDSTFINTARGAVVREDEMIQVLSARPDLYAILDVTHPEPPAPGSPLYTLPNVVLTPHIAGAMGAECLRMGSIMVEELRRYLHGDPLRYGLDRQRASLLA